MSESILFKKNQWPFGLLWSCPKCEHPLVCLDVDTRGEKGAIIYWCGHCQMLFSKNLEEDQR